MKIDAANAPAKPAAALPQEVASRMGSYKVRLTLEPTQREYVDVILRALLEIGEYRAFNKKLDDLVGWKNLTAWARWAGRALEPAMLVKMRFSNLETALMRPMQDAGVQNRHFANRFLEELVLVCQKEQNKADVSFSVGMAFMCFGPLLAPLSAAAGAAAGAGIAGLATTSSISAGKSLVQMGVTAGAGALTLDPNFSALMDGKSSIGPTGFSMPAQVKAGHAAASDSARPRANAEERTHGTAINPVNPMQYASCLFDYLNNLPRSSRTAAELIVIQEFGGQQMIAFLDELLDVGPDA
jgi:hypothetical protein